MKNVTGNQNVVKWHGRVQDAVGDGMLTKPDIVSLLSDWKTLRATTKEIATAMATAEQYAPGLSNLLYAQSKLDSKGQPDGEYRSVLDSYQATTAAGKTVEKAIMLDRDGEVPAAVIEAVEQFVNSAPTGKH